MAEQHPKNSESNKFPIPKNSDDLSFGTKAGMVATIIYLAGLSWWMYEKWCTFSEMQPNSWGDFLAGTFGPLAFLWLVLGYMQQGRELRINSEALRLQAEELANSVAQQKEIAEATKRQVDQVLENHRAIVDLDFKIMLQQSDAYVYGVRITIKNHGYRCTDFWIQLPPCRRSNSESGFQHDAIHLPALNDSLNYEELFFFERPKSKTVDIIEISYRDGTGDRVVKNWEVMKTERLFSIYPEDEEATSP